MSTTTRAPDVNRNAPDDNRNPPSVNLRDIARLVRRFELTIPLRKPLVVRYRDIMGIGEHMAIGLPHAVRRDVLYVMTDPGRVVGIPVVNLLSIKLLYPE